MKRIWVLALLGTIALAVAVTAAPQISVDSSIYNFGSVLEGDSVPHTFILTNVGDEMLVIEWVRASCGCTATILSKKTLAPGESISLETTLRTNGYGGRTISKSITVKSNDLDNPELILSLTGTVLEEHFYSISAEELNHVFYLLIDLRRPEVYAMGHLMGAINIPYDELAEWIELLPIRVRIVLYDQDSSTSDLAVRTLVDAGFAETRSLLGGIDEWTHILGQRFVVSFKLMKP